MKDIFRSKQDLIFYGVGSLLVIIFLAVLIYSVSFLVKTSARAFNPSLIKTEEIANFNLNDLQKIKPLLRK